MKSKRELKTMIRTLNLVIKLELTARLNAETNHARFICDVHEFENRIRLNAYNEILNEKEKELK